MDFAGQPVYRNDYVDRAGFADIQSLVLAGNGYFYGFAANLQYEPFSDQVSAGTVTLAGKPLGAATTRGFIRTEPRFIPRARSAGLPTQDAENFSVCAPFWLTEDGTRLIDSCGGIYTASPIPSLDLQPDGSFSNLPFNGYINAIQWAVEADKLDSTAVIPGAGPRTAFNYNPMADTYVQIYGAGSLQYSGELSLATFTIGSTSYAGHGRYAFWNSSEDKLIILEQADSTASLLSDYGVAVYSMTPPATGCAFTPGATSATLSSDQGSSTISVTTGAGCIWEAVSNASWITLGSGGASFGPAVVTYSVSANTGSTTRSGPLTIAGQTFTVTQTAPSSTTVATAFAVSAPESATVGTPCRLVDTRAGAPSTVSSGALIGGSNQDLAATLEQLQCAPGSHSIFAEFYCGTGGGNAGISDGVPNRSGPACRVDAELVNRNDSGQCGYHPRGCGGRHRRIRHRYDRSDRRYQRLLRAAGDRWVYRSTACHRAGFWIPEIHPVRRPSSDKLM